MKEIPIKVFARQSLSVMLEQSLYEISLKECNGIMAATVIRDGVTIVSNRRVCAGMTIIPEGHLEEGNFVILTENGEIPYYTGFESTDVMVYLTIDETQELRLMVPTGPAPGSIPSGPLVDFDYMTGKLADGMGIVRASSATVKQGNLIKSVGNNVARFETNGLLIEDESVNFLLYSSTFTSWWGVANVTKSQTGPVLIDTTQSTLITATGNNFPRLTIASGGVTNLTNDDYAVSFIIKKGSTNFAHATIERTNPAEQPGGMRFFLDFTTGQVTSISMGTTLKRRAAIVEDLGDGWFRLSALVTVAGLTSLGMYVGPSEALGLTTAQVGDSINVAHAQFEKRSFPTSPIITTTAAGTRAADVITLTQSGAKTVYREYIPLGATDVVKEFTEYNGVYCPPGHLQKLKVWNRELTDEEKRNV